MSEHSTEGDAPLWRRVGRWIVDGRPSPIEAALRDFPICEPCVRGEGSECHTPNCALFMRDVPPDGLVEAFGREPLGHVVRLLSDLIDGTYPADLDPEAHLLRRVMKVSEETGEVTEALFGALGENRRKGQTHTMQDVRRELLDVALAALSAIAHFDDEDPIDALDAHARSVQDRLARVIPAGESA